MASLAPRRPLSVACAECLLRLSRDPPSSRLFGALVQTRGKKKNARGKSSIPVRLIQDLPGYGRKGSIVPIGIGPMRNVYFPQRIADYLTLPETKQLKRNGVEPERDFSFGRQLAEDTIEVIKHTATTTVKPATKSLPPRIKLDLLEPSLAFDALKLMLPPNLTFYRTPISQAQDFDMPQPIPSRQRIPGSGGSLSAQRTSPIYGSVNVSDVTTSIKSLIANSSVAGRVVVNDEDIRFITAKSVDNSPREDQDLARIKRLGDFEFEIRIKGHPKPIKSQIKVIAGDDMPADTVVIEEAKVLSGQSLAGETKSR